MSYQTSNETKNVTQLNTYSNTSPEASFNQNNCATSTNHINDSQENFKRFKEITEILKFNKLIKCFKNIANLTKICKIIMEKLFITMNDFDILAQELNISNDK